MVLQAGVASAVATIRGHVEITLGVAVLGAVAGGGLGGGIGPVATRRPARLWVVAALRLAGHVPGCVTTMGWAPEIARRTAQRLGSWTRSISSHASGPPARPVARWRA